MAAFLIAFASSQASAQATLQTLHGHVRPAVTQGKARFAGSVPSEQTLSFSIILPLRNEAQLDALLQRLSDPSSADYRQFLSVAEFTEKFAPSAADYAAVVAFAKSNGLEITGTPANRMIVPLRGTVGAINSALHVRMSQYQHPTESRTFYSPDREPSLALGVPVTHIAGLNNFSMPKPMVQRSAKSQAMSGVTGSGPGGSYLGSDMRKAYYGGTQLTGAGQAVGLLEFDGYDLSDVNQTFKSVGQSYTVAINNVLLDGASGLPNSVDDGSEEVLDIVQAIGMAPGLSQVRVYIGTGTDDANVLNSMASENIAKSLSSSWAWLPEDPGTDDVFFKEFAAQGQSFFVASGDYGAWDPSVDPYVYPAEDTYVTTVGATHLTTAAAGGAWQSESVWNSPPYGSGGGVSPDGIPIASWQKGLATSANGGSNTLRNAPDVAMEGDFDNYTCVLGYCYENYAGTSFAAPRWAGFIALVNQQAAETGTSPKGGIGFLNPALYSIGTGTRYANDFHDVVTGNNDSTGQTKWYVAGPGYDLTTGWGSPTGQNLIDELAGPQAVGYWLSAAPSVAVSPGGVTSTTVSVVDAGGFTGKVQLAITSALPAGVTATWGTNPTTGSSLLTFKAASTAANTTSTLTITGTSGKITETTHLTLTVHTPTFALSVSPSALQAITGNSSEGNVTVTPLYGFTGNVSLSVSGLPAGVTAAFGTNPTSGSSLLTIKASSTAVAATSNLTITGKSGTLIETTVVPLTVVKPTFTLSNQGPVNLGRGTSATAYIFVQDYYGFAGQVSLSVSGLPAGMTASFGLNPASNYSALVLTAGSDTPLGTSTITVLGKSGSISATTTFKVNVLAPSFTLSATTPSTIGRGTTTTVPVTINPLYGFSAPVSFSLSGLPSGVTASWAPNPAIGNSVLTLTASSTAPTGTYNLTLTGTSGSIKATTSVALGVYVPTFTITSNSPLTVAPGQSSTTNLAVNPLYGFTGSVTLAATGLPSGVTASFSPNPTTGIAALTLQASSTTPVGNSTLTVTGTSGSQSVKATIPLTVAPGAFTLQGPGDIRLSAGSSNQAFVSITPVNGFAGSVTLSLAGLPSGVTASFAPNPTTSSEQVTLTASSAVKPGSYTVTINGTSPNTKSASTTFPLSIVTPGFTLSNFGQVQLGQGLSANATIQVNADNGFDAGVHLSVSGLPSGVTASFAPAIIAGGSTALTFVASSTAKVGTSTITVTGTSGTTTQTTTFPLQVGTPTFTIDAAGSWSINPGGTTSTYVTVNPQFGFIGSATLSISGLPAGVTAAFVPDVTSGATQLNLTAGSSVALGTSAVTITGISGTKKATASYQLTVSSSSSAFSLQLANSSVQFAPGSTTTDMVSLYWWTANTSSPVSLSISGLPAGVTASFSPASTSTSSVLTVKAASTAAKGMTTVTITGTQGKITATTSLQLDIEPASFTLSGPGNVSVAQGQNTTAYIYLNEISGFTGAVNLSASGLPAGVTASFSPNPTQTDSAMVLTAASSAALASSIITITGTSGSTTSSVKVPLTVVAPAFSVTTQDVSLGQGASTTSSIYIQGQNGFSGNVNLSISGLPSGVTASIAPNPTTSFSTVTLTASATASVGQYNAVITGTSGKLTGSGLLNIIVGAPSFTLNSYGPSQFNQGTSTQIPVQVVPLNGFTGSPLLSITGLPSGVTASFLPNPTNGNSILTLNVSSTSAVGQYNANLVGTYGKQVVTLPLNLSIYAPSFTLYTYPSPVVNPGSTGTTTINLSPAYGFNGSVRLAVTGLPAGVTAAFSPVTTASQSQLTFSAASTVTPGEYNLTVTGTSGTKTSTIIVPLTVAPASFTLWSSGVTVGVGTSATSEVGIYTQNGFNQPVRFAASGLPAGVTVSFSPNPTTDTATVTTTAASSAVPGQYIFTVTGTGGGKTASTLVTMQVGKPSFTLSAYSMRIGAGSSATEYLYVNSLYGFNGAVQFSVSGLPAGVTASFSPWPNGEQMTLNTASTTKPGDYSITLTGKSGSLVATATTVLTVVTPTFSLFTPDSPTIGQGTSTTAYVYPQAQNGFSGNVTLSISGLPAGVTGSFSPNPATTFSTLTLTAASTTKTGQYTAVIKGTSGSITATTPLIFMVAAPSFTLGSNSAVQLGVGTFAQDYISVNSANGFNGQVQFSVSGLPAGVTASFAPSTSATSTWLTLTASASAKPGQYTCNLTGKSGSLVASTAISLTIVTPSFELGVSSIDIGQGTSSTDYVFVSGQYGFSGKVQLSASGLPSGVTASFSPNPTTGGSMMTLKASSTASLGQYTVTVNGASGTQQASATFSLGIYVPTFTINDQGNVNMGQGTSNQSSIFINQLHGFNSAVQLSVSGLPTGMTATFSQNPTSSQFNALTLTASGTLAQGTYPLTIIGKSGTQVVTVPLSLGIFPPSFTLSGYGAGNVNQGGSASTYIYVSDPYGLAQGVQLSISGLPSGVTASFSPNPTTYSSLVTLTASSKATPGKYTVAVTGTSGTQKASMTLAFNVVASN